MSDQIIFNPDQSGMSYGGGRYVPTGGAITRLTMKLAGIEDEAQANKILLTIAGIFFAVAIFVLVFYV